MGDAAKVIDWNGTDVPADIADVLAQVPPGRYRLEAVTEGDGYELTPEQEAGIEAAIRSADAGRSVPWATVKAELDAKLAAYPDR